MAERHDDIRFEPTDVSIGPVVSFIAGLAVMTGLAMVGLWYTQRYMVREERADKKPERPLTAAQAGRPDTERWPPEPRIEGLGGDRASHSVANPDVPSSARNQRAAEEEKLRTGWTDAAGKKHPPIDEAIKLFLQSGGRR